MWNNPVPVNEGHFSQPCSRVQLKTPSQAINIDNIPKSIQNQHSYVIFNLLWVSYIATDLQPHDLVQFCAKSFVHSLNITQTDSQLSVLIQRCHSHSQLLYSSNSSWPLLTGLQTQSWNLSSYNLTSPLEFTQQKYQFQFLFLLQLPLVHFILISIHFFQSVKIPNFS